MMRVSRLCVVLLVALVVASAAWLPSTARMNGVSGRAEGGCACHGGGAPFDGVAGQLPVLALLDGAPEAYEPGQTYELSAAIGGDFPYLNGGFNLNASAGMLTVPAGEDNVQITTLDTFGGVAGEATHKTPASRSWRVDWTAPREGVGQVTFRLAVNSVNGNSQPDQADLWNLFQVTSQEVNVAPVAPIPEVIGVGPGAVNVSWAQPPADLVEIQVHGGEAGFTPGGGTLLATVGPAERGVSLTDLPPGPYTIVLRVIDQGGLSADSEPAAVTIPAPAPEPVAEAEAPEKGLPAAPMLALIALVAGALIRRRP